MIDKVIRQSLKPGPATQTQRAAPLWAWSPDSWLPLERAGHCLSDWGLGWPLGAGRGVGTGVWEGWPPLLAYLLTELTLAADLLTGWALPNVQAGHAVPPMHSLPHRSRFLSGTVTAASSSRLPLVE